MATPVLENNWKKTGTTTGAVSMNIACDGGVNNVLIAIGHRWGRGTSGSPFTAATIDGNAMTLLLSRRSSQTNVNYADPTTAIFYYFNPPSGTKILSLSGGGYYGQWFAAEFSGVDSIGQYDDAADKTVTLSGLSVGRSIVLSHVGINGLGGLTAGTPLTEQDEIITDVVDNRFDVSTAWGYGEPDGASDIFNWTTGIVISAVELLAPDLGEGAQAVWFT